MTVDISSEAVEDRAQCADAWGEVNLAQGRVGQSDDMATLANTLRAQAERIKELETGLSDVTDALELANMLLKQKPVTFAIPLTNQFNARHAAAERGRALIEGATND